MSANNVEVHETATGLFCVALSITPMRYNIGKQATTVIFLENIGKLYAICATKNCKHQFLCHVHTHIFKL